MTQYDLEAQIEQLRQRIHTLNSRFILLCALQCLLALAVACLTLVSMWT